MSQPSETSRHERLALTLLAALALITLIDPLARLPFWLEQPNEGWNAIHAMHAFSRALYPPPPAWIINNYPPLWFYLTGALAALTGDPVLAGRAVATFAFFGTAAAIALLLRRLAASVTASLLGALSFVAITAGLLGGYVGLSEPQMLAHGLVTSGVALLVGTRRRPVVVLAALAVVTGIFVKPIVIALPLAATLWLPWHRRASLWAWVATGAIAATTAFAAVLVGYGMPFIANLTFPRVLTWHRLGTNLALISKPAVSLVAFALVAFKPRALRDPALAFAALAIACAIAEMLLFGGAVGVSINIVFDLVIASSIGLGLAFDHLASVPNGARWRVAVIVALIVRVAIGMLDPLKAVRTSGRAELQAQQHAVEQVAATLRPLQGPVACEALSACAWAGHPSDVDLWKLRFETTLGSLDKPALIGAIREGRFAAIVTYANLTSPADDRNLPGLYDALRAWYEPPIPAGQAFLIFVRKPR